MVGWLIDWLIGWLVDWVSEGGREGGSERASERVSEINKLSQTANSEVHVIYKNRVIITSSLESLYSLTQIAHNLQVTIDFKNE